MNLLEQEGPVLTGRMRAQTLRRDLEAEISQGGHVVLDFAGIEAVSPSFADEIFVRFVGTVGEDQVTFANLSDHLQRVVITVRRRA